MSARYPWHLPSDHPLYHPFYGFNRPMTRAQYRSALAAWARRFKRELAEYESGRA